MADSLKKELKLRELFTKLVKKKGYEEEIFHSEIFAFFGIYRLFTREEIQQLWKDHVREVRHAYNYMCLYIHVPFCRRKCSYCKYRKGIYAGKVQLDHYLPYITEEMQAFQDIFKEIKFKSLHFGGGTPNLLKGRYLKKILTEVNNRFRFEEKAIRTFECNPYDSSPDTLKILADFGINRVSFGVQSLDSEILLHGNRGYQNYDSIRKAIHDTRKFPRIERINADLLIGLYNDTPQSVLKSFIELAALNVDSISLYPLTPTSHYFKRYYNNRKDLFDRELAEKLRRLEELIIPAAEKFGYGFLPLDYSDPDRASWDFGLKKNKAVDRKKTFYKTDDIPFDCLGVGMHSWSMITNTVYYRNEESVSFSKEPETAKDTYEGLFLYGPWSKIFFVVIRFMQRNRVSTAQYKARFGTDVREDFKELFHKLERLGAIIVTDKVIFMTAKTHEEKFTHLLFFIDNQMILDEFDKLLAKP